MTDLFFPSEDHRRALVDKVKAGGLAALDDIQKREFHGYRYAWRRVRLADFTQKYGCDPRGDWFDGSFVNQAVTFYTGGKGLARVEKRAEPTPEQIARVEAACAAFRQSLANVGDRNRAAFGPPSATELAVVQAGLGLSATEHEAAE